MAHRFDADIDRLRASLASRTGPDLRAALAAELEAFDLAALATDSEGRYVAVNTSAQRLTGYSRDELTRMTVMDLTPPPSASDGQTLWGEFIASGVQQGIYELRRNTGRSTQVRYWAYANIAPGIHLSLLKSDRSAS